MAALPSRPLQPAALPLVVCGFLAAVTSSPASAQSITYTSRTGGNTVYCGPLPIVGITHQFTTPVAVSDPIAVSHPGAVGVPASAASAQFDALVTTTGISLAVAGSATRGSPPNAVWAAADGRDDWQFTIATPVRFTLTASLSAASTEATVPPSHFTFSGGSIVADPGSPLPPYQQTITAPGTTSLTASGVLLPGAYSLSLFGRAEGTTFPFTGSYSNSISLALQPTVMAAEATRTAAGNPDSYICSVPVLGQTWNAAVDVSSTGHSFAMVFASPAPTNVPLGPGLTVLIDVPVAEFLPITAGPQAVYHFNMPPNPALAGMQLFTQALHFGGPPTLVLSNARDLTLGF